MRLPSRSVHRQLHSRVHAGGGSGRLRVAQDVDSCVVQTIWRQWPEAVRSPHRPVLSLFTGRV